MSMWARVRNVFRGERLDREIDEEIASHMDEAREDGRDTREARRALGSPLKLRDEMHDAHVLAWLDSLRADAVYGWRRARAQQSDDGCSGDLAGPRDWGVHGGVPPGGCADAHAAAYQSAARTLQPGTQGHRP